MIPVSPLRNATAVLALIGFCLTSGSAAGHGGVVEEDDLCVINIGYLKAHFKIYVPQVTQHEEYCEDIPVRGESLFVMEYQHDGLNEAEIDFRIIRNVTGKGVFARIEDIEAIQDIDAATLHHQRAAVVRDVFMLLHDFEYDGEFVGIVSARLPDTNKSYTAVFPFEVGYTGLGYWPWIIGAVLLLQLNYWYMSRRKIPSTTSVITLFIAVAAVASDARADDAWLSDAQHFRVTFESELQPLTINRIHHWILHIEDARGRPIDDASITFTGGMPEHDHGLPTAPRVTDKLGDGDYRVEGIRFHMRGYWEILIRIDSGTLRDSVTIPLTL